MLWLPYRASDDRRLPYRVRRRLFRILSEHALDRVRAQNRERQRWYRERQHMMLREETCGSDSRKLSIADIPATGIPAGFTAAWNNTPVTQNHQLPLLAIG